MCIMVGKMELIKCLADVLDIKDVSMIAVALRTLRTLFYFGDCIADEMNLKNVFYQKACECDFDNACNRIKENFYELDDTIKLLKVLENMVEICKERAEIDDGKEKVLYEFEIN